MGLTKEERKAKKEAKKLEKLRAEDEARKKVKRLELVREMTAQAKRRSELDRSWREMMLKIKEPVFAKDIQVMWQTFERSYDKKDHLINYTMKLSDVADDQFQRTVASFCDTIDTMIIKFLQDLDQLSVENELRTANLLKRGENEAATIAKDHTAAETHLQLLLYHAHTTADKRAWATRGENLVKEDEERGKYANDRENLRSFLESDYSNMWDEYKAVLKSYVTNTAENQKKVRRLRRKENTMADVIASQGKKIANSDGILKRLRLELQAYESGTKQAVFRDRRNRHRAACYKLKQRLVNGRNVDEKQMDDLVRYSDNTLEWLEGALKKGEKILRLAALCRKYETLQEKIMPYGSGVPQSPSQSKISARRLQTEDSLVLKAMSTTSGLTRLWHRIANAELTKRALLREKEILERENAAIMMSIEEYDESKPAPQTFECICGKKPSTKIVSRPTAIEGVLQLRNIQNV